MPKSIWIKMGSALVFWLNVVNTIAVEDKWKLNFRMSREEMINLC